MVSGPLQGLTQQLASTTLQVELEKVRVDRSKFRMRTKRLREQERQASGAVMTEQDHRRLLA